MGQVQCSVQWYLGARPNALGERPLAPWLEKLLWRSSASDFGCRAGRLLQAVSVARLCCDLGSELLPPWGSLPSSVDAIGSFLTFSFCGCVRIGGSGLLARGWAAGGTSTKRFSKRPADPPCRPCSSSCDPLTPLYPHPQSPNQPPQTGQHVSPEGQLRGL